MRWIHSIFTKVMFATFLLTLTAQTAWAETVTLTSETGAVTLNNGDVLAGTGGADTHVTIADGATVTLNGVTITSITNDDSHKWAGITCEGDATIRLADGTTNIVKGGYRNSGVYVPAGKTLTIQGGGSLDASSNGYAAGIGAGRDTNMSCGNIIIAGGNITATGGQYGAGIGAGNGTNSNSSTCGNITISGGTITANGGSSAAGIGSGSHNSVCGNILISSGTVNATGGDGAAGIGSGDEYSSSYGTITISGGTVTATGGDCAAGIGAGTGSPYGTQSQNGDIQITGGSVTATGGAFGAGIGSAGYSSNSKSNCGNITIVSGTIKSTKGTSAPNSIGAGLYGTCGTVTVGGVVGAKTDNFDQTIVGDTYTVSFNANGGTGDMSNQTIYRGIATPLTRNTFTRDGYVFIGWSETAGGDVAYPDCKKVTDLAEKDGTKTLYAKWMSSTSIPAGLQVDAEYAQTEAGFYYVNMPIDHTTTNVTISDVNTKFKIYDDGGKNGNYTKGKYGYVLVTVPEGYKVSIDGTATFSGELHFYDTNSADNTKSCGGWALTHTGSFSTISTTGRYMMVAFATSSIYDAKEGLNLTTTVAPVTYNVRFNANATEGISGEMADQTFTYGEGAKALTENAYTRTGYTFAGWATSADGNVVYADGAEVSNLATTDGTVIELFAKWTLIDYPITYNLNGGTNATGNPATYTVNTETFTLADPSKDSYTFAGWFSDAEFNTPATTTITKGTTGNKTFWAKWTRPITSEGITVNIPSVEWTGSKLTPVITVKDGETTLTEVTDYTVTAPSGTIQDAGDYTYTISGTGNYTGSTTATFTITPKAIGTYGAIAVTEDQNGKTATIDASLEATIEITSNIDVKHVDFNRSFTANQPATVMLPFSLGTGQTVNGGSFYKFSGVVKDGDIWKAQFTEAATLKANTPYLFNPSADGNMTFDLNNGIVTLNTTTTGESGNTTTNWEFHGTYQKVMWNGSTGGNTDPSDLSKTYGFAKGNSTTIAAGQFVHFAAGAWLKPMRCYLVYNGSTEGGTFQNARRMTRGTSASEELPQTITVVLLSSNGGTTSVGTINALTGEISFDGWYTMDGRKLDGKPTKKGLYINNGRKVVIK